VSQPLAGHVYGNTVAPVTIVEFGDYECPYCAGAAPVLRELIDTSAGRARLIFRNFPLFEVHPHALTAALAAESVASSAGESVFWQMHFKLFVHQARLTDYDLRLYAESLGADPLIATGDAAQKFAPIVQADYAAGIEAGVSGTPTLFINDDAYAGRIDVGSLRRAAGLAAGGNLDSAAIGTGDPTPATSGSGGGTKTRRRPWQRG
jgi:protein-disulfide isomerase